MSRLETEVPAYSMWSIFYDTIQLLEQEQSESKIKLLAGIVNSENLTNIFIYSPDVSLSYEQYEEMSQRYKAFTVWLLGRFFYLLSCEDLIGVHKIIMDAQLRILHLISITQAHYYYDISKEYSNILKSLNSYNGNDIKLTAFKLLENCGLQQNMILSPITIKITSKEICECLKFKVLVFINCSVTKSLTTCRFSQCLYDDFDNLILILKKDIFELKFFVLKIYGSVLENDLIKIDSCSDILKEKFDTINSLIEVLITDISTDKVTMGDENLEKLQDILVLLLESDKYFYHYKVRIAGIIFKIMTGENTVAKKINDLLIETCFSVLNTAKVNVEIYLKGIDNSINNKFYLETIKSKVFKDINSFISNNLSNEISITVTDISSVWQIAKSTIKSKLKQFDCINKNCVMKTNLNFVKSVFDLLVEIRLKVNILAKEKKADKVYIEFFNEADFFLDLISFINKHIQNCKVQIPHDTFIKIITHLPLVTSTNNLRIYFHVIAYQFLSLFYKSNNELPYTLNGCYDRAEAETNLKLLYNNLAYYQQKKELSLRTIMYLYNTLSSGLCNNVGDIELRPLENNLIKIVIDVYTKGTAASQCVLADSACVIMSFAKNLQFIRKLLLYMMHVSDNIATEISQHLPKLVCVLLSKYVKIVSLKVDSITTEYICLDCNFSDNDNYEHVLKTIEQSRTDLFLVSNVMECAEKLSEKDVLLTWKLHTNQNVAVKRNLAKAIPSLSRHVLGFNSTSLAQDWLQYAENPDKDVRRRFCISLHHVMTFLQENERLPKEKKEEIMTIVMDGLFAATKRSLQHSNYDLQDTILDTVGNITHVKHKTITLSSIKILLYFIMIPTSKYSGIAENYFSELANKQNTKSILLYGRFRKELCQYVVELCAMNQALVRNSLAKSLENVSLVLGFSGPKDFITKENHYLMPYFVSLIVLMPDVLKLIQEAAAIIEMELKELLASNYGNIFLYIFLNKDEATFKECMFYVEQTTGMNGNSLRKRNFKTILNELLLNYHDKQERVLLALKLLATEDTDGQAISISNIPDYLQPRFLGVLQYFDTKLFAKKQVLLSLSKIFQLMGPKRIAPFRLKIIAMLRTALNLNYSNYPEVNCNVWNAFVHSCDIESLGPQLATIFVSLTPLVGKYPEKINGIFRYLVKDNEALLKEYIPDLFFVLNFDIDNEVKYIVKRYNEDLEESSCKGQIKKLMKYLTHETNEVRVHALKYLKKIIEDHHKDLDQMILGYNGIDNDIIELLDTLMRGCREKDGAVKLACGECIGELGAIEPSHLPRKYSQASSFIFFLTEDAFIFNSLNELIRALQAEKNTTVMDKFALAIQEILKMYGISPYTTSPKHHLWQEFPQSHQELILPFLSSRYTVGQALVPTNVSPIYGSTFGANFQSWVHNWTVSLIMAINADKRNLLEVCLPSLKQDQRTLMHFLPHILLHSLLEGSGSDARKTHNEFMAVINSFSAKKQIEQDLCDTRPLRSSNFTSKSTTTVTSEDAKQNQCTKVTFVLLDFLDRWKREWEWQRGAGGRDDDFYKKITSFLSKFCKLQLAKCSFICGEYPRTLMYLEDYVSAKSGELGNHLSFLAHVYAQLDEPDAVAGVNALQDTEPTLEQRILALELSGKLSDAAACYERIPPPLKLNHLQGLLQCYLDLDNVNTALHFIQGAVKRQPEYENQLFELEAEPLWRLGQYEGLDKLLDRPEISKSDNWGVNIGRALLEMRKGERNAFRNTLDKLRLQQVDVLGATSLEDGAYQHGYGRIVKLQALNELEQIEKCVHTLMIKPNDHNAVRKVIEKMSADLELRLKVVQESIKVIDPILCIRRVALNQAKRMVKDKVPDAAALINGILGESWLRSAKIARNAGGHQQAYTYALKAEEYAPPKLFIEKAKLHWLREEHEQALGILRRGIEKLLPLVEGGTSSLEKKKICAEAKLLIASYNDSISNVDREVNIMHYKEALEMDKECEKSYVCLAQYYDRIFHTFSDEDKDAKGSDIQIHMINYFGKSMLYGTNYIYQSMPRVLSIWFDYGTRLLDVRNSSVREERRQNLLRMTKLIDSCLDRLPAYMFLTAFSQIISRICHPQKEVYIELKSIIIKLILQYPQQSMWMMISVIKSSYAVRSKRCAEILGDPRLKVPNVYKLVTDFTKLAEKLIELCNKDIQENTGSINLLLRSLPRLLAKDDFSEIMVPTQKFRKLVLPNPDFSNSQHNPFPNHYAYIAGIEDKVVILNSLQRPKKIIFRGSDGKGYVQMLKPKDDLRKDFRLMEFNDIVNQLLSSEPESRQRRLNIRLYSVAPLNEECGLIEWIHDLVGLRIVLVNIYKQIGQYMKGGELKAACCNISDPLAKKRDIFEKKLLARHPPVLGDWFRKTFPDAQSWLTARTAYTRTTAVMSMVGYILGLGDRHGENILLDSNSGDAVHVDFNCLFNKGETFEWPERVPFRLTHNMVSAMGPLGVEGIFRKSCACTLKVLRTHANTLMSIVTPFVYDPLVSWPRNTSAANAGQSSERTNEQAVEHIRNIEQRLQGIIKTRGRSASIPLSVEGQSNNIIQEAMNIDNLCQMYIGWGAYL